MPSSRAFSRTLQNDAVLANDVHSSALTASFGAVLLLRAQRGGDGLADRHQAGVCLPALDHRAEDAVVGLLDPRLRLADDAGGGLLGCLPQAGAVQPLVRGPVLLVGDAGRA